MDEKTRAKLMDGLMKTMSQVSDAILRAAAAGQTTQKRGLAPGNCGKCPKSGLKLTKG